MRTATNCRSCNELIFFVKSRKGKNVPMNCVAANLDEMPPNAIVGNVDGEFMKVSRAKNQDANWYVSHFSTCPAAAGWRNK